MASEISFGEWIKRQRRSLGMTQQQLADLVGCATITIRKIEADERRASAQIIGRLVRIFDVDPNEEPNLIRFARGNWDAAPAARAAKLPWQAGAINAGARIPLPTTSFIGRQKELTAIRESLRESRLVTLKGPGGVGKTRLAIEASRQLASSFPDGACWVDLAGLNAAPLVPQAVMQALGLREIAGEPLDTLLMRYLASRQLLLILDNCEHLTQACARLAGLLLGAAPGLVILATSRDLLEVTGERVWPVPALSLPDTGKGMPVEQALQFESVRLLVERARTARSDFELTDQNAADVVRICLRLDGMPLAIELAAARLAMMSSAEISRRLDNRFHLLAGNRRAPLPRHETLRAAIDWSYDLLSEPERTLFRRLAVFANPCTLAAAETIGADALIPVEQVIALLGQLINKSLVVVKAVSEAAGSETRYGMFETIHEYAREKLLESSESQTVLERHGAFFRGLAEQAQPELSGTMQVEWLDRLDAEYDNLRVLLQRAHDAGDRETLFGLVDCLLWFWYRRGHLEEGRAWLERAAGEADNPDASPAHARALHGAAMMAQAQGDYVRAQSLAEASVELWQRLGEADQKPAFEAKVLLGELVRNAGDPRRAQALLQECVAFFREQNDPWCLAWALMHLGMALRDQQEYAPAKSSIEESAALWRRYGDLWGEAASLHALALVAYRQHEYRAAYELTEETLPISRQLGDRQGIAYCTHNLGVFALAQGNQERAIQFFEQDLELFRDVGDWSGVALCQQYRGLFAHLRGEDALAESLLREGLELAAQTGPRWVSSNYFLWLASIACQRRQFERAVKLCSAARLQLAAASSFWDAFELAHFERITGAAWLALGEEAFARERACGESWTQEQTITYALGRAG